MDTHTETTPTIDLEPAARQIASLLDGIDEQQLDGPTPVRTTPCASCSPIWSG